MTTSRCSTHRMRARVLVFVLIVLGIGGCSFVHQVRIENVSDAPVTIAYKLRPTDHFHGMFFDRLVIMRKQGREMVRDTTTVMNPADSVVTFTLAPGDRTTIAWCMNCTLEGLLSEGAVDVWAVNGLNRVNLYWMRIEQNGQAQTYSPQQLVALATKKKTQLTLFRIETS